MSDGPVHMKKFNLKVSRPQGAPTSTTEPIDVRKTRARSVGSTSNASSSSSKMVGLGIARRPSDNLLLKYANTSSGSPPSARITHNIHEEEEEPEEQDDQTHHHEALSPPNRARFSGKGDRPISNDSISTRASELFSSPSSDLNSSIDNDVDSDGSGSANGKSASSRLRASTSIHQRDSSLMEESIISEGDSTLILGSTDTPVLPPPQPLNHHNHNDLESIDSPVVPQTNAQRFMYSGAAAGAGSTPNLKHVMRNNHTTMGLATGPMGPSGPASGSNTFSKPSLYGHSNSTTAILPSKTPLTASQRYRMRREQNEVSLRHSIKEKEKFYEEQNGILELQEGDIDDSLIWNIPMASFSTSSFLNTSVPNGKGKSRHRTLANKHSGNLQPHQSQQQPQPQLPHTPQKHAPSQSAPVNDAHGPAAVYPQGHNHKFAGSKRAAMSMPMLDFGQMPTSPIPGINNVSDLQYIQETTKNLSSVYLHSQNRLSRSKLSHRAQSAEFLPLDLKAASEQGMEDLLLVSSDKLDAVSNSRPSWLPPKDPEEKKLHDYEISKSISMASIEQLDKSKNREEQLIRDETNRAKLVLLLDRDITRNSSLASLKKIVWETSFSTETRAQIYSELLQSKDCIITERYVESFDKLTKLLNTMDFPKGKEVEIQQQINNDLLHKRAGQENNDKVPEDLMLLLKMKAISQQGLIPGDALLFYHFLLDDSFATTKDVWNMVSLVQMTCFSDLCKSKYDAKILQSRGVVANYLLKTDDFKAEFNPSCLNSTTWWNILERVDHQLFMWIIDVVVVGNAQSFKNYPIKKQEYEGKDWETYRSKRVVVNYKIQLAFALNVLLNYHFGFNDLNDLAVLEDKNFSIPIPMEQLLDSTEVNGMLIRKWLHYYKKF